MTARPLRPAASRRALLAGACAAAASAALSLGVPRAARAAGAPALKAGVFEPPRPAPEIKLQGSDGRPFELAQQRGKVVLLAFGFTSCPAVCPITLGTLAQARRELGAQGAQLQVVFVTVDPERDDAPRMKAYLAGFDPSFIGATGSAQALGRVYQSLGVQATKVATGSSYAVDHTSSVFLVDRQGRLRGMMPYGRPAQDYVHDVRLLLAAR